MSIEWTGFPIVCHFSQRRFPEACGGAFETSCMYVSGIFDRLKKYSFLTELGLSELGKVVEIRIIPLQFTIEPVHKNPQIRHLKKNILI